MRYYAGLDVSVKETQKRAVVALRGRLAVIMHRMWSDETEFCWSRKDAPSPVCSATNKVRRALPRRNCSRIFNRCLT